jgi:hypothetical protein
MRVILRIAKVTTVLSFLVLLLCTYIVRGQALDLNRMRLSADAARAAEDLATFEATYDDRVAAYEMAQEHYRRQVERFRADYDAWLASAQERGMMAPSPLPPRAPQSPEATRRLAEISAEYRAARYTYIEALGGVNGLAALAALVLTTSLLTLVLGDTNPGRWMYLALLGLAFVFMIGPALHSVLTGVMSAMRPPAYESMMYNPYGY